MPTVESQTGSDASTSHAARTPWRPGNRPIYDRVWKALESAHAACFNHPDRDVLGMSSGPFSGVNETLGVVATLEDDNQRLAADLAAVRAEIERLRRALLLAREWLSGWASAEKEICAIDAALSATDGETGGER